MKILITGAGGFIGGNLTKELSEKHEVVCMDKQRGGVCNRKEIQKKIEGVDVVLHHAAMTNVQECESNPIETIRVNFIGTMNVLDVSTEEGVKKFINISSAAIYRDSLRPRSEDGKNSVAPDSIYGYSKYWGELISKNYNKIYGIKTTSLRYFNVYGGGQKINGAYGAVIPTFVEAIRGGKTAIISGNGEQTRDFVYIKDIIRANKLAIKKNKACGESINIGTGVGTSILELFCTLRNLMGCPNASYGLGGGNKGVENSIAETKKAQKVLGFKASYKIEDGLRDMLR